MIKGNKKVFPTAQLVAQIRIFTDIPYSNEISKYLGKSNLFTKISLLPKGRTMIPILASMIEMRYKKTNQIIKSKGITQVIEFGGGNTPRGIELTKDNKMTCVITDMTENMESIKKMHFNLINERNNLYFFPVDIFNVEQMVRACEPLSKDKPIAIVTEGVMPYYNDEKKKIIIKNCAKIASMFKSTIWILGNVIIKELFDDIPKEYREGALHLLEQIYGETKEHIYENASESEKAFEKICNNNGFNVTKVRSNEGITLSSIESFDSTEIKEMIKSRTQDKKTWILSYNI